MTIETATTILRQFFVRYKRLPTYREMNRLFGFASKNASYELVTKMVDAGILHRDFKGNLTPRFLFAIPHMGIIKAGSPVPPASIPGDSVDFYRYLLDMPPDVFSLTVSGDSMIEEGINDGDLAIVERGREPKVGDIVAATIDGECTLKLLKKNERGYYLKAANPRYPDIYPLQSLQVDGVVIHVIRKYH
jgi:SOS-response transcriptional repressor LexA